MSEIVLLEKNITNDVVNPGIHDGLLTRIEITEKQDVELTIKGCGGITYVLSLSEVHYLFVSEFGLTNIILSLNIEKSANCDVEDLLENLGANIYNYPRNYINAIKFEASKAENNILTLTPSQGASVCAVFQTVKCWQER